MTGRAPCYGKTDLFVWPNKFSSKTTRALAYCATCPPEHKVPCDKGAIGPDGEPDYYMIRAGLTPKERFNDYAKRS